MIMDKKTLIQKISALDKEDSFSFFEEGRKITSRFNLQEGKTFNQGSARTELSKALYAIVTNLSVLRAQGSERSRAGLQSFDVFLGRLVSRINDSALRSSLENEKKKAMMTYRAFLEGTEKVTMADILAKTFPLLSVKASLGKEGIDKKTFQDLSRGKEVVFNQTALFVRSLFHAFLTLETTDPFKIKIDIENLDAPYFLYGNTLMFATDRDSFTLSLLKQDLVDNVQKMADNFAIRDVDSVAALYLLREIFAVCSIG